MKVALTVNKEDALQIPNEFVNECTILLNQKSDEYTLTDLPVLEDLEFELQDRAICEKDFTKLQPLPYVTIFNRTTNKFFTYLRGKGGDEGRLHDMLSIGLGGHIEDEPNDGMPFSTIILNNIIDELREEANIILNDVEIAGLHNYIENKEYKLIYTTFNEVAQVHLCMWFCIELDDFRLNKFEEGTILSPRWFSFEEFDKMIEETGTEMEYWTQLTYQMLKQKYQNS